MLSLTSKSNHIVTPSTNSPQRKKLFRQKKSCKLSRDRSRKAFTFGPTPRLIFRFHWFTFTESDAKKSLSIIACTADRRHGPAFKFRLNMMLRHENLISESCCLSFRRNQDLAQRKEYVKMHDDVLDAGGDVRIFSSMHVSGERKL